MPAFDPNLVTHPDPVTRIANAYQAALDYAAGRLTPADYATLQAQLTAAGLPTDSDDVLTAPNPALLREGVIVIALAFVTSSGRTINPDPVSTLSPIIQALKVVGGATVNGDLSVVGDANLDGDLSVTSNLVVNGILSALQGLAVNGSVTVTGSLGVGVAAPASGIATADAVRGDRLIMDSGQDPALAANGTLAEDASNDLFYKDLSGTVRYISRPQHDTGWIDPFTGSGAAFAVSGGFLGINNPNAASFSAPDPTKTPDIYDGTGFWTGSPGTLGDPGAVTRLVVWHRIDANAFVEPDPVAKLGVDVVTPISHYSSDPLATAPFGVIVSLREDNGDLNITFGEGPLVAGYPGTVWFQSAGGSAPRATYLDTVRVRVMAWTR